MLAAILLLCGTTTFTSCTDENDNPVIPEIVDEGAWTLDENIDATIKAGDDFFMHANGTWWNKVDKIDLMLYGCVGFMDDINTMAQKLLGAVEDDNLNIMEQHEQDYYANAETDKARMQQAVDILKAATTKEELWSAMGLLKKMGFQVPFQVVSLAKDGIMRLVFIPYTKFEMLSKLSQKAEENEDIDFDINTDDDNNMIDLLKSPLLTSALEPICAAAKTRGVNQQAWPMLVKICEAMGIDPEQAFIFNEDYPHLAEGENEIEPVENLKAFQEMSFEKLSETLLSYISDDLLLYDEDIANSLESDMGLVLTPDSINQAMTENYMAYYLSYAYARKYVTPEMKERGEQFVAELMQSFRQRLAAYTWLSDASKQNVLDKLDNMIVNVASPEWMPEGLIDLSQSSSIFEDVLEIRSTYTELITALVGKSVKEGSFHSGIATFMPIWEANAYYAPNFNSINILPIWLMTPLYDEQACAAYNYATLTVFGHEITHAFDNNGAKYNKYGDIGKIWASDADEQKFDELAQRLSEYYSSVELLPGLYANGEYTLPENIADLGGVEMAYNAFNNYLKQQGFSGDELLRQQQRFFYGYAHLWQARYSDEYIEVCVVKDEHSLPKERINCVVANMNDWYDVFNVKEGDKLYQTPEERIHIW